MIHDIQHMFQTHDNTEVYYVRVKRSKSESKALAIDLSDCPGKEEHFYLVGLNNQRFIVFRNLASFLVWQQSEIRHTNSIPLTPDAYDCPIDYREIDWLQLADIKTSDMDVSCLMRSKHYTHKPT